MNSLLPTVPQAPSRPMEDARQTANEVIDAFFDGANWSSRLCALAAPQDLQAVEALEGLLDLARTNQWADLGQAVEGQLRSFPCTSSAYFAAKVVVSPSPDDILFFARKETETGRTGEGPPMWQRAIERWVAQGGPEAFAGLVPLLDSSCSGVPAVVRAALRKMQDGADASLHADINRLLGTRVPDFKVGTSTVGDGNCLIHAMLGTESRNGYQCNDRTVRDVRQQLGAALASPDHGTLAGPIAEVARGFYEELLAVRHFGEALGLPNRKALQQAAERLGTNVRNDVRFDELAFDAQRHVIQACADFFAEPGHYLPCSLVPLLAQVSKRAVSLYVDQLGWQHFDANGQPGEPVRDAVAIRFHARRQHYERVEGPPHSALPLADDVDEGVVPDEPQARAVPKFPVVRRSLSPERSETVLSTRVSSSASLLVLPSPSVSATRKAGLVTRFFNWVGQLFR